MREEPDELREGECGGMSPGSWRAVGRVVNTVRSCGERRHPLRQGNESLGGSKPTWAEPLLTQSERFERDTTALVKFCEALVEVKPYGVYACHYRLQSDYESSPEKEYNARRQYSKLTHFQTHESQQNENLNKSSMT